MLRARDNPFATDRVLRERYRLDESGWALIAARLRALRHRGAIVGPHGSGKTTLLEDLALRLTHQGWRLTTVRLTAEFPRPGAAMPARGIAALEPQDVLLIDGAEQLSRPQWWWWRLRARGAGGIIITSHAPGRLPTLWRCRTTPELLRELSGSLGVALGADDAAELFTRHSGNLRNALRELYDRHAEAAG